MNDYLVRVIAKNSNVRGLACVTTRMVNEARRRHGTAPTASAALGRALTGGALMGALLKSDQRLVLNFEGDGPLRKILVEADSDGAVRGYVRVPDVDLPPRNGKLDVAGALGRTGHLMVIKDLNMKEPYKGVVNLYSGEIAEDLAYYLTESEQIPSAVGLGVFVESDGEIGAAGGFLVQALAPVDEEAVEKVIGQIDRMPPVTEQLRQGGTPENMLEFLFSDMAYDVLEKREVAFRCSCSTRRVERALISLGRGEIEQMLADNETIHVVCEFCGESYTLEPDDLRRLAEEIG